MTTLDERVILLGDEDVKWGFGSEPTVDVGGRRQIDPHPCYHHDVDLTKKVLRGVDRAVGKRVSAKPTVYVASHEGLNRTNGEAFVKEGCDCEECVADGKKPERHGVIVMWGKRIPPLPAMTRYLVGHEYGHNVEYELLHRKDLRSHDQTIRDEYAKMRGLTKKPSYYGGRQWHLATGEVIANDFRILVAELEPEFWPHEVPHPSKDKTVQRWWEENL